MSQSPSELAGHWLGRLSDDASLVSWREFLQHSAARQDEARRKALFTVPLPRDVARALNSGPPAVPADLRAVVREALTALACEIRNGPTSPWRGFWNRPYKGKKTAKIENECRDLLADRLSDRLAPFRIPVRKPVSTETRSASDRRVDMVVLGTGTAALPIEVKRHWNPELWTAPVEQLEPYARSLETSGNGIYLVLWFGSYMPVPKVPNGIGPIRSAEALQAALKAHLPPEMAVKFDVLVFDVSDRETVTSGRKCARKPAKPPSVGGTASKAINPLPGKSKPGRRPR